MPPSRANFACADRYPSFAPRCKWAAAFGGGAPRNHDDRPQITKNLFSDTNLSTRFSILKWALESIFAKENEILCDFRFETAKKLPETAKNSDF